MKPNCLIAKYFRKKTIPGSKQILKSVGDHRQTSYSVYSNKYEWPMEFSVVTHEVARGLL